MRSIALLGKYGYLTYYAGLARRDDRVIVAIAYFFAFGVAGVPRKGILPFAVHLHSLGSYYLPHHIVNGKGDNFGHWFVAIKDYLYVTVNDRIRVNPGNRKGRIDNLFIHRLGYAHNAGIVAKTGKHRNNPVARAYFRNLLSYLAGGCCIGGGIVLLFLRSFGATGAKINERRAKRRNVAPD